MIIAQLHGSFKFKASIAKQLKFSKLFNTGYCCICGFSLEVEYVFIIEKLRESGLLPKDHNLMCCTCYRAFTIAKSTGKARPKYRPYILEQVTKMWRLAYPELDIIPRVPFPDHVAEQMRMIRASRNEN